MKIDASLLADSPLWNREVAEFLSAAPLYSRHDNLNRHRKLHVQPGYEIDICLQGRAIAVIGDRTFLQSTDSLLIIPGHVPHQIYPDLSVPYRRTVICFDDRALRNRLQIGETDVFDFSWLNDRGTYSIRPDMDRFLSIKSLAKRMCDEIKERANGWETMALSHLLGIAVLIDRWKGQRLHAGEDAGEKHYVALCCEFIAAHLHEDLSLSAAAKLFAISPEQLIRSFKREKGMTYYQYVLLQRITESKKLLRTCPDMSMTEIAYRLGFRSSSQFSRVFRSAAGMTPSEYRAGEGLQFPSRPRGEAAAFPGGHGGAEPS